MSIEDLPADHREHALLWRVKIAAMINTIAVADTVKVEPTESE